PQPNPLFQLAKVSFIEPGPQLGLAGQHHGNQLFFTRFGVRQKADLFEERVAQTLGLVYHERSDLPTAAAVEEQTFELFQELGLRAFCALAQLESLGEYSDELLTRQRGVAQAHRLDRSAEW